MLNKQAHTVHMVQILTAFYKQTYLSTTLGFKGGTACYLFHNLPRFSTDLDFDLTNQKANLLKLTTTISSILSANYIIQDHLNKLNTLFWLLSYGKGETHIKVEISTRNYPNTYEQKNLYGCNLTILSLPDIIAHKLVAITDRPEIAYRDLFDAHFFLSSPTAADINYSIIKNRTNLDPIPFYKQLLVFISKINNHHILEGLGEVLTQSQKDWVRAKLLSELTEAIHLQIDTSPTKNPR